MQVAKTGKSHGETDQGLFARFPRLYAFRTAASGGNLVVSAQG